MKWIRIAVICLLSALVAIAFGMRGQQVDINPASLSAIGPEGEVYLLSEEGRLEKISRKGTLVWSEQLPVDQDDGTKIRYGCLTVDRSGGLYMTAITYRTQVDAAGQVQNVILSEQIQPYDKDGVLQNVLLEVDETALSEFSTTPYIRKLQMHDDYLYAMCINGTQVDVICTEPYDTGAPRTLSTSLLGDETMDIEDMAALGDGTLIFSTHIGELYSVTPDGVRTDLQSLAGAATMVGAVSSDETDSVYFMDRTSGAFFQMDLAGGQVSRLYSSTSPLTSKETVTLADVRNVKALGDGSFGAVSVSSSHPFWLRFGATEYQVSSPHRGWSATTIIEIVVVFVLTAVVLFLLSFLLQWVGRRSMLTSRILLWFLPVQLIVLAMIIGGFYYRYSAERQQVREDSLASAARSAASLLAGNPVYSSDLLYGDLTMRDVDFPANMKLLSDYAVSVAGLEDANILLYLNTNDTYYGVWTGMDRDAFNSASYLAPISQELEPDEVEQIMNLEAWGGSLSFLKNGNRYTSYFLPITVEGTAFLVEARLPQQSVLSAGGPPPGLFIAAFAALAVLMLWLLLVLMHVFLPLKDLRRCIGEISNGNWNVRASTSSGDELADISLSFNQMAEKLNQYISNMVMLNTEYIKFTPRELFQLLGKTKITDLRLRDMTVRDISLLYVNFRTEGTELDSQAYFSMMNESFDRIFDLVDRNRGIIERFDGSGMMALFPYQVRDALNTAVSLKELLTRGSSPVEMKMLISADATLVGVAGNEKRQTITAISDTIMDIYALDSLMDELGTRYIITRRAVERLSEDFHFTCREIGSGDSGRETLFEFLDGMDPYEKKLHLVTKEEFELGIHAYQEHRYHTARKHFVNVLQTNEKDRVAMCYLMLCDLQKQRQEQKPEMLAVI